MGLVDAAERVHEEVPSFVLILAGAGTDERIAEEAARTHDFIHFVGPVLGMRKAALFAVSRVVVMPGLVGLGIVDAFHFGVPPIATTFPHHSPEFVYLEDGENGLVTENCAEEFAAATAEHLVPIALGDPHSPWQRGSIENATGVLRRDLPRKTDLADYSQQDIHDIVWAINTTPRKCLGFLTPAEAFLTHLRCCT